MFIGLGLFKQRLRESALLLESTSFWKKNPERASQIVEAMTIALLTLDSRFVALRVLIDELSHYRSNTPLDRP
jgi:hypothetical protein